MLLALKKVLYYVHKPLFRDCICTSPSFVCYCMRTVNFPMSILVLGKERYAKKYILADKWYMDTNGCMADVWYPWSILFFFVTIFLEVYSRMEHQNWTELALTNSEGITALFGAKSKS